MSGYPCESNNTWVKFGGVKAAGWGNNIGEARTDCRQNAEVRSRDQTRDAISETINANTCNSPCQAWYRVRYEELFPYHITAPDPNVSGSMFKAENTFVWALDIKCERRSQFYFVFYQEESNGKPRLVREAVDRIDQVKDKDVKGWIENDGWQTIEPETRG